MTMIRMQARSHASEENGQSGTAEISGKLVFYSCTRTKKLFSRFKLMFKTLKPRFKVALYSISQSFGYCMHK